jgi:glutathione S-transferase
MLTLRSSPASPFVRKIRIAANVLGLERDIAIEPADTMNPDDSVRRQNPLGKIPALVLEDGTVLFDSRVILDYLDHRAGGGRIVPNDAGARFHALRLQALADGVMDASVLLIYEGRWRPAERHEPKWVDHQAGKVARTLAALEAAPPATPRHPMWVRSRLPARSAIAISASRERGGGIIRRWWPGSTNLPRACLPSPRPSRRARRGPGLVRAPCRSGLRADPGSC